MSIQSLSGVGDSIIRKRKFPGRWGEQKSLYQQTNGGEHTARRKKDRRNTKQKEGGEDNKRKLIQKCLGGKDE